MVDWFKQSLIAEGMVGEQDLGLLTVVDSADEVLDTMFRFYETSGSETCQDEQEIKRNL